MPRGALDSEDVRRAQAEAVRGAGVGALKWGVATAILGGLGYALSPVYRGLTIQFKVYVRSFYVSSLSLSLFTTCCSFIFNKSVTWYSSNGSSSIDIATLPCLPFLVQLASSLLFFFSVYLYR